MRGAQRVAGVRRASVAYGGARTGHGSRPGPDRRSLSPSHTDLARQYKLMQSQLMAKIIELQERERVLQDQLGACAVVVHAALWLVFSVALPSVNFVPPRPQFPLPPLSLCSLA